MASGMWRLSKKVHQVVDIFQRGAAGGDDDRLFGLGDFLDQDPVIAVGAGDFEDLNAEFAAEVHGGFVEGRGHADAAGLADGLDQGGVVIRLRAGCRASS